MLHTKNEPMKSVWKLHNVFCMMTSLFQSLDNMYDGYDGMVLYRSVIVKNVSQLLTLQTSDSIMRESHFLRIPYIGIPKRILIVPVPDWD